MASPIVPYSITAPGFFGLNTQDAPVDMNPSFALEANNCIIDKAGRIGSRKGWTAVNTVSADLGTATIDSLGELVSNSGTRTIIAAGNNFLFKMVSTTLTKLTYGGGGVAPTITASNWKMVMLNGAMLFFQRSHDPLIYDPVISTTQYRRLSEHASYSGTVPLANTALVAYGRVWCADTSTDKNTVSWSDTLSYMKWTGGSAGSLNLYGVWPNGGDEIVAIAAHNNNLIIFGRRQILIYSGADDPNTMKLEDTISNAGCLGRDTVQNTPTDIIFLSNSGVSSIKRVIQEKSAPILKISQNVNNDVLGYVSAEGTGDTIKAVYSAVDSFYLLTFPVANMTYCFDMRSPLEDGSHRATRWIGFKAKAYVYSNDNILKMGFAGYIGNHTGYLDNTETYRFSYFSTWIDFGDPVRTSILKKLIMTVFGSLGQTVTLKWGFDYKSGLKTDSIITTTIVPALYGVALYGVSTYSSNLAIADLKANTSGTGKVIQVGMETIINGYQISLQRVDIFTKNGAYTI